MKLGLEFNQNKSHPHPFGIVVIDPVNGRALATFAVPLTKADHMVKWIEHNTKHYRTDFYKWGQSKITGYDLTTRRKI